MEKKLRYRNDINKCALCYQETKRVNQLLLDETPIDQIKILVFEENVLQQSSADMQKRVWKEISYRLSNLDEQGKRLIQEEDNQSSKALIFYSILQVDKLFLEFCRAVYLDKLLTFHQELTKKEIIRFIETQIEKDEKASKWSTSTIAKLAGTYIRILIEVGALDRGHQINRLTLSPETRTYLKEHGYRPAAEVVLGGLL